MTYTFSTYQGYEMIIEQTLNLYGKKRNWRVFDTLEQAIDFSEEYYRQIPGEYTDIETRIYRHTISDYQYPKLANYDCYEIETSGLCLDENSTDYSTLFAAISRS